MRFHGLQRNYSWFMLVPRSFVFISYRHCWCITFQFDIFPKVCTGCFLWSACLSVRETELVWSDEEGAWQSHRWTGFCSWPWYWPWAGFFTHLCLFPFLSFVYSVVCSGQSCCFCVLDICFSEGLMLVGTSSYYCNAKYVVWYKQCLGRVLGSLGFYISLATLMLASPLCACLEKCVFLREEKRP